MILTAVINIAQDVSEDVDLLASLPSRTLDCSLQFDRDFVANNEEVAAALEALLEDNASEESGASRDRPSESEESVESVAGEETERDLGDRNDVEAGADRPSRDRPSETDEAVESVAGEEAERVRGDRNDVEGGADRPSRDRPSDSDAADGEDTERVRGDRNNVERPSRGERPYDSSSEETDEEGVAGEETATGEESRRGLRGRGRGGRGGRRDRDVTLEAGATRPPRGDKPCDSSDSEDEEEDVADEETDVEDNNLLRRALRGRGRGGRGRGGRRDRDVTLEAGATRPPRGDRPCDSSSDEETDEEEADAEGETATEETDPRRALRGRGRGRGGRRNRDVTLEAGATRPPRGDRPCDSSDETDEETTAEEDPVLRRLLRRGRDSSEAETDEVTEDSAAVEREPCTRRNRGRGRNNRRNKDTTTETPQETEGVARRALKGRRGSRRSRRVEATISNGSIEVAGLTGEVVFGEVNEDLESMPLTITVGETTFACDVEIGRRNKVSCRAISEDNFRLRVKCELPADEE